MSSIKDQLQTVVEQTLIPESESYLEELLELVAHKTATLEDMEAIKEMESFLVELQNILEAIAQNMIDDEQAQIIYEKIQMMLDEHELEHQYH
ncbi:MAG: hypothetical protein IE909_06240 [Campylobacterales bacterium]|nr:hypothetical protein [Campylobacterales bacterium]